MKSSLLILFVSAGILSAQTPAPQQAVPQTNQRAVAGKRFLKLDKNGDNKLNLEEFKAGAKDPARAEKRFHKLDTNHDGFLSPDEIATARQSRKSVQ